jgi:hypothetical protein
MCHVILCLALSSGLFTRSGQEAFPVTEWNPCGPSALYACARLAGMDVSRARVIELCRVDSNGACTAADLTRAARAIGFRNAAAVQTTVEGLSEARLPAIVHDNQKVPDHFVAVIGQRGADFLVFNPATGHYWIQKKKAAEGWDGCAVLLSVAPIPILQAPRVPLLRDAPALGAGILLGALLGLGATSLRRATRPPNNLDIHVASRG